MKTYKSHKTVQAARITHIEVNPGMGLGTIRHRATTFTYEDGRTETLRLNDPRLARYTPVVGDYLVRYVDGYEAFSPAKAFLDGYTEASARHTAAVLKLDADFNLTDLDAFKKHWAEACKNGRPGDLLLTPAEPDISVRVRNHLASALPTKITREALMARIKSVDYEVRPDGRSTMCEITLVNGWAERGWSASVSAEEFNKELGEKYAYEDALSKVWAYEAFLLRDRRFTAGLK